MAIRKSYYVKPGNFENLKIVEEEIIDPSEDEIQIEVKNGIVEKTVLIDNTKGKESAESNQETSNQTRQP